MILRGQLRGKVGRRRDNMKARGQTPRAFFFMLRQALVRLLRRVGYRIAPLHTLGGSPADIAILDAALPFTMTSPERVLAVIDAVRHVVRAGVPGAVVECGVWRGGSMVAAARTLLDS